jgi:hypothetical protein
LATLREELRAVDKTYWALAGFGPPHGRPARAPPAGGRHATDRPISPAPTTATSARSGNRSFAGAASSPRRRPIGDAGEERNQGLHGGP